MRRTSQQQPTSRGGGAARAARAAVVELPDLVRVRQRFAAPPLPDVRGRVEALLAEFGLHGRLKAGARVAITAGSRGITDGPLVLRTVVSAVSAAGGQPFLVPCMGSHGGATADGQLETLAALGVQEATCGAPLVSSMDVLEAGASRFGSPVWVSRDLAEADAVIVVNRVKPHTDFRGPIESGLIKMLVIGAGKHRGAAEAHRLTIRHGFPAVLEEYARVVLSRLPVLCGIAIVENQQEQTAEVHVLQPDEFVTREPELLKRARALVPSLPFDKLDCLVVDLMGKEISGAGMDTGLVGRINFCGSEAPDRPRITRIVVRDLSPASHGNAIGIGMADFVTSRLLAAVDRQATAVNCITSMCPEDARLPIGFETDVEAVEAAYLTSGAASPADFTLAWIQSTASVEEMLVSTALLEEVTGAAALEVVSPPISFPVDAEGGLHPNWGDR